MEIYAYVLAIVLFIFVVLFRRGHIRRSGFEVILQRLEKAGFTVSGQVQDVHNRFLLLLDTANRRWILLEQGQSAPARTLPFEALRGYALLEDHRLKKSGGVGAEEEEALSGRALVRFESKTCGHMEIRLYLAEGFLAAGHRRKVVLSLLADEVRRDSVPYENARTTAREISALLDEVLRPADEKDQTGV